MEEKYEKCPICEGRGILEKENAFKKFRKCHICLGLGILEIETGLPLHDISKLKEIKKRLKIK
jgi:hypothetical protein